MSANRDFWASFSWRRADTVELNTSPSPNWPGEGGQIHVFSCSRLHRPFQPVIVSQLMGCLYTWPWSLTIFVVCRVPTFSIYIYWRTCHAKMRPTPSCLSFFEEGGQIVETVWIQSFGLMSQFATHHCCCGFSSITVRSIHWILGSEHLLLFLACHRPFALNGWAIGRHSGLEKSTATPDHKTVICSNSWSWPLLRLKICRNMLLGPIAF